MFSSSNSGVGNYFCSRATLCYYLCLANHIAVKKAPYKLKIALCGPYVVHGPYVAPSCSYGNTQGIITAEPEHVAEKSS